MKYNPAKHNRKSIRLKGYDYTQPGYYFITIVTKNREHLFGEMIDKKMILNEFGEIAKYEWFRSEEIRREMKMDEFAAMPNHIHGITIILTENFELPRVGISSKFNPAIVGADGRPPQLNHPPQLNRPPLQRQPKSLGSFVAGYESVVTSKINQIRQTPGTPVWLRNYWEHIIRNESELNRIRQYIMNNPKLWKDDRFYDE